MKILAIVLSLAFISSSQVIAQLASYDYAPSKENPFGKLNPKAPKELGDYEKLIGACDCKSYVKNKEGEWAEPIDMVWTFKYIMNGTAVQDGTLKVDGGHTGSIRVYQPDSAKWYVHYFATKAPVPVLSVWEGGNKDDEIILYREVQAPNGTDGFYKIRFHNISEDGFNWLGTWVTPNESFKLETWKIDCVKRKRG